MPKQSCQQCDHRLPYAAHRCPRCGWERGVQVDPARARARAARRRRAWAATGFFLAFGSGMAYFNAPVIADWYAGFAARHLPGAMSSWAPAPTDQGAFFFCARQVSRKMDGDFSVETFAAPAESFAESLDDGRYRIVSWVEEAPESGSAVRHAFACTVRFERGRWALDDLRMEQYAADGSPPALIRRIAN